MAENDCFAKRTRRWFESVDRRTNKTVNAAMIWENSVQWVSECERRWMREADHDTTSTTGCVQRSCPSASAPAENTSPWCSLPSLQLSPLWWSNTCRYVAAYVYDSDNDFNLWPWPWPWVWGFVFLAFNILALTWITKPDDTSIFVYFSIFCTNAFLYPFGSSVAACIFSGWSAYENLTELRCLTRCWNYLFSGSATRCADKLHRKKPN